MFFDKCNFPLVFENYTLLLPLIWRTMIEETILVNGKKYITLRMMGRGKGGYSYLAKRIGIEDDETYLEEFGTLFDRDLDEGIIPHIMIEDDFPTGYIFENYPSVPKHYVLLKMIHHEPCDYYSFGNKIEAEKADYKRLVAAGIRVPKMYSVDEDNEIIIKEFIDGPTVMMLLEKNDGCLPEGVMEQGREMAEKAKAAGLNIDYYPTNFILDKNGLLYYIDYECNPYMDEWSFDNWGLKYWTKAKKT